MLLSRLSLIKKLQNCLNATTIYQKQLKQTRTYANFTKSTIFNNNLINNNNNQLIRCASGIVQSPLGTVKISNDNLIEYIWKNYENCVEKPAAVSST